MKLAPITTVLFLGAALVLLAMLALGIPAWEESGTPTSALLKATLACVLVGLGAGASWIKISLTDLKVIQISRDALKKDYETLQGERVQAREQIDKLEKISKILESELTQSNKIIEALQGDKKALEAQVKTASAELSRMGETMRLMGDRRAEEESRDAVAFLTILQERGRLIDFLMEDITSYSDAQVGAASRIVHQGCRKILQECFSLAPITKRHEGQKISLANLQNEVFESGQGTGLVASEEDSPASAYYRLIGKVPDEASSQLEGILVHRGWVSKRLNLPKVVHQQGKSQRLSHIIAPAEIEV